MVPYDYTAGRLALNSEEGRLEIDCNGEGALFAAATSELTLAQLPDIGYPNPAFSQLILQEYGAQKLQDLPLLFIQVCIYFHALTRKLYGDIVAYLFPKKT